MSYAVAANKPDIVRLLLMHAANTSLTDMYNLSAKDIADTKGFTEVIDTLALSFNFFTLTFFSLPRYLLCWIKMKKRY